MNETNTPKTPLGLVCVGQLSLPDFSSWHGREPFSFVHTDRSQGPQGCALGVSEVACSHRGAASQHSVDWSSCGTDRVPGRSPMSGSHIPHHQHCGNIFLHTSAMVTHARGRLELCPAEQTPALHAACCPALTLASPSGIPCLSLS